MAFFKREYTTATTDELDYNMLYQCLTHCDFSKQIEVDIQSTSRIYPVVEILNRVIAERQTSASDSLMELDGTVQDLTNMTSIHQMLVKIGEQSTQLAGLNKIFDKGHAWLVQQQMPHHKNFCKGLRLTRQNIHFF